MEYLKETEDYLLEEIQKYLNLIELETTDVTYKKVVYDILITLFDNNDIVSFTKNNGKVGIEDYSTKYLDYSKNNNIFILEHILNTVKSVLKRIKQNTIDNIKKFFFTQLKKNNIIDKINKEVYFNKKYKANIVDNNVKSTIISKS